MGRDNPELPDPLENQGAAAGGTADDLLSQLAGDEIDRMLAEADADPSGAPPADAGAVEPVAQQTTEAPPPTAAKPAAAGQPPLDAQLEDLFKALNEPAAPPAMEPQAETQAAAETAPAAETPAAEQQPSLDAQLDDLFNALNEPVAAPAEVAVVADTAEAKSAAPVSVAASDLDAQLEKLAQELLPMPEQEQALTPVEGAAKVQAASESPEQAGPAAEAVPDERAALLAETPAEDAEEEGASEPVPWYLRPLVWLNAPFASLSDSARDALGKAALATLLFSVTVLTFLALTRHRL